MIYLCFAHRTNSTDSAHRFLIFVAETPSQFNINLILAEKKYKNTHYEFECVKVAHDGNFWLKEMPITDGSI